MTEFYLNTVTAVGLERTTHSVSESASFVEICIILTSSMTSCPFSHQFTVTLSLYDESAGSYIANLKLTHNSNVHSWFPHITVSPEDYEALNLNVTFSPCEKRRCVNVSIVDDYISEPEERFTTSLSTTPDLSHSILVHPTTGEVTITDDDGHSYTLP